LDLRGRGSDEMPTRLHICAADMKKRTGAQGRIDVGSIEVEQYNPATGEPVPYGKWAYAHADWELPYRWYDDSIPRTFQKWSATSIQKRAS